MMILDNFTEFFYGLSDEFFIHLYEEDYAKIEQMCMYLTLDQQLKKEKKRKPARDLDA